MTGASAHRVQSPRLFNMHSGFRTCWSTRDQPDTIGRDRPSAPLAWRAHFGFRQTPGCSRNWRHWICEVTFVFWRQWQNGPGPFQGTVLWRAEFHAAVAAGSPTGFRACQAIAVLEGFPLPYFAWPRISPTFVAAPSLTLFNCRGTDPYARWCGRYARAPAFDQRRFSPIASGRGDVCFDHRAALSLSRYGFHAHTRH